MHVLEATYRITTPMFLGRDPRHAELRAASIRGVLRFWFRAASLATYGSVQAVREAEERIFGTAASDGGRGTGVVLLRVREHPGVRCEGPGQAWESPGSAYLGYGVIDRNRSVRPYLAAGGCFTVTLLLRPHGRGQTDRENRQGLITALKALGLLGGLGSRSRKGFGSVSLLSLRDGEEELWRPPRTAAELAGAIRELIGDQERLPASEPEYTAFSRMARVLVVPEAPGRFTPADPPGAILDAIGREMLRYRSYGRYVGGRRLNAAGEAAECNFAPDHDNLQEFAATGCLLHRAPPARAVFGLPHPYWFRSVRRKTGSHITVRVTGEHHDRRASPLFIHIHHLADGTHAAVFTFLPARFLPEGEGLALERWERAPGQRSRCLGRQVVPAPREEWGPITAFLNRPAWQKGVRVL